MNKRQNQKITMLDNVQALILQNAVTLNKIVHFTEYNAVFNNDIIKLRGFTEQQVYNIEGNTDDKKLMKAKLIPFVIESCKRLKALSVFNSDSILLEEMNFQKSYLDKLSSTKLRDAAQAVYNRVQANILALADYGSNATTQAAYLAAINAFIISARKPKSALNSQKVTTQRVDEVIKQTESSLNKIDILIDLLIYSHPDLHQEYWNARRIGKRGTRYVSVVGRVSDAITKEGIKGVMISFILDSSSLNYKEGIPTKRKNSAQKGGFTIKNMLAGIYQVILKKNGYKEVRTTIVVNDGEMTRLMIEMTKLVLE